jgi:dephospho-CoA kinase
MISSFDHHLRVYVAAESELRFQRLRARNEKPGEEGMSYEQFLQEEQAATEREIPKIGATADVRLENNGTKDAFAGQVKMFCDQFLAADKF